MEIISDNIFFLKKVSMHEACGGVVEIWKEILNVHFDVLCHV